MKRKPSSPNHIQTVSKEPVSGIQMARVADEKARVKLRPWVCCDCWVSRMGSSFSTGRLDKSAAGQPAPQSRNTSSARSVWKYKNSHNIVCLLNENYEQIAIACVGMADVDIQIILEISEEVWYLNVYLLVTQRIRMGSSGADSRLHTSATTATSWPGSLITNSQPSTQQELTKWRLKYKVNIYIMFCIRIIIEPYHFVMLLEAEDTGLQFCLILSWPLLSREKA